MECVAFRLLGAMGRGNQNAHTDHVAPDKDDMNDGHEATVGAFVSGLRSMETTHQPIVGVASHYYYIIQSD